MMIPAANILLADGSFGVFWKVKAVVATSVSVTQYAYGTGASVLVLKWYCMSCPRVMQAVMADWFVWHCGIALG